MCARARAARASRCCSSRKARTDPLYTIDFKGIVHDRYRSAASGRDEIRWLGKPVTQKMPVYGSDPDQRVTLPTAWWVSATAPQVIERLKYHGIAFETLDVPRQMMLDMVRLGHVPLSAADYRHEQRRENFAAGSVRVPADQPLGLLAWNFFPGMLQRTEYIEGYAIAPLAYRMLAGDLDLRCEFEARLAADPSFVPDGNSRLAWSCAPTPYYDERYLLYPIGRELR